MRNENLMTINTGGLGMVAEIGPNAAGSDCDVEKADI